MLMTKFFFLTIILSLNASTYAQDGWTKVLDSKGIEVYNRPVKNSAFDEFKGISIVNAKIETIGEVLRDINNYPNWVADISEARILHQQDRDNMQIYLLQSAPWPVSNREMILKVNTNSIYEKGYANIRFVAITKNDTPFKKGAIRITDMEGSYLLEYISRNQTKVTYTVRSNPGGSIPASIANMAAKDLPYKTLEGLKKMVQQKKYIDLANQSPDKQKIEDAIHKKMLPE
jgi:ribosome-associated toxin RatA of RatAB toxin-antitoxin module